MGRFTAGPRGVSAVLDFCHPHQCSLSSVSGNHPDEAEMLHSILCPSCTEPKPSHRPVPVRLEPSAPAGSVGSHCGLRGSSRCKLVGAILPAQSLRVTKLPPNPLKQVFNAMHRRVGVGPVAQGDVYSLCVPPAFPFLSMRVLTPRTRCTKAGWP